MTMLEPQRRTRSDGARTRASILQAAAALATTDGLDRLSLGHLAEHIGISKSGLFSHFHSKEALQLATIDVAWDIFDTEVVRPALATPEGRPQLLALIDRFLDHLERRVFPGGCFFAATAAELHMRPSVIRDRLDEFDLFWSGHIRGNLQVAMETGQIDGQDDLDQLAYEIGSHLLHAHLAYLPSGDGRVLERSRAAIERRLGGGFAGERASGAGT